MTCARTLLCGGALLAAGCSSQWFEVTSNNDIVRTDIVIRTEPAGATLTFDGVRQIKPTPIRLPVEYDHIETLYERQANYGSRMREGMSGFVEVLAFPVWGIASFFHYRNETRRHTYGGNIHTILAEMTGRDDAQATVTLEGEAEHPVTLKLLKSK